MNREGGLYRLFTYWRSSSAWRIRIVLAWKGLPWEACCVDLGREDGEQNGPEYRGVNPAGRLPTLAWTDAAGQERALAQSMAIFEYLETEHPAPPLLPQDSWLRARTRELALTIVADTQPLQNSRVLRDLKARGVDERDWARKVIAEGLDAVEARARETAATFLVGETPTWADVCLVPQLYNARRFGLELSPYETLLRVERACQVLPAFATSEPHLQPDAPRG